MAAGLHISINAEKILDLGGIPISNSILTTWVVLAFVLLFAYQINRAFTKAKSTDRPSRFQSLVEMIIEGIYNLVKSVAVTDKKTRIFFPLVATFLFFILFSNWAGLIPGVGTIGFTHASQAGVEEPAAIVPTPETSEVIPEQIEVALDEHGEPTVGQAPEAQITTPEETEHAESVFVPLFRGPTADLNTTLALAVIAMLSVQVVGFKFLGFHYPNKFINIKSPMDFFVGILEFVSEISKVISFAFRLFGNIFAGEVLLAVMAFLMPLLGPVPFLGLEIFVGFIQALVFSMLTLVFMNMATVGHAQEH